MSDMPQLNPILESTNFIVLDKYIKPVQPSTYQTEADLERELIADLCQQGYEYLDYLTTPELLLVNLKTQMETLNHVTFTDSEWQRFLNEYLNKPSDSVIDRTRKLHDNYICDFTFDDGHIQNIYLWDTKNISRNNLQVINQMHQTGVSANRYDVTLLVNGLPLVQIELKKRGVAIRQAFNQVHRYSKESFNEDNSLFKYLQLFVISNGTDTRYFANTTKRENSSFDFTMNWALKNNEPIHDLKDFTSTFFHKNTLLNILIKYSIFDTTNNLLIMRPYQIAATERIIWKIKSNINSKQKDNRHKGGYIWHTTGSGKTLTSFKAAQLATAIEGVDKVFFVVDRKDLDFQTMKEYQRFSPDSVNGSINTSALKKNIAKTDHKIIVTTIQKLHHFMKSEATNAVYNKHVVFIFDECHRSQFGEVQALIHRKFKSYSQFGFTGTPILPENAIGSKTTANVFGEELHSYVITDAIRDKKVLKFMIEYNTLHQKFNDIEKADDKAGNSSVSRQERELALLHPDRIKEITSYILENYNRKTHRIGNNGFNALFAVSSIEAAKSYYNAFKEQQIDADDCLKIATIFSYAVNDEQSYYGEIADENFDTDSIKDATNKEFLDTVIADYNTMFQTNYSADGNEFQNYYRDLSNRVKTRQIDLLIVVGMFLTGFDAPILNTLFVDKSLRYHGLIQAFSRTNRIYNASKSFGNIVTFRDLEHETAEAIKLFGKSGNAEVLLERPYHDYLNGYDVNAIRKPGYIDVVTELQTKFSNPNKIEKESDKKEFVKLFGKFLRLNNLLKNYDEHAKLLDFHQLEEHDDKGFEAFCIRYHLDPIIDRDIFEQLRAIPVPEPRMVQDWTSKYYDIKDEYQEDNDGKTPSSSTWDDVTFELELLTSQEINLDYILELILNTHKKTDNKEDLIAEIKRVVRSSVGTRAKEDLIVAFINETDLDSLGDTPDIIAKFFSFAQKEKKREIDKLIEDENLNPKLARHYIASALKKEYATDKGSDINNMMPKLSPFNKNYLDAKQKLYAKIKHIVDKFKGVGGES